MNEDKMRNFIESIDKTYPGIKRFSHYFRDTETGITIFVIFDLNVDSINPIYALKIPSRDLLICGDGFVTPMQTYQQYLNKEWDTNIPMANY